MKPGIDLTSPWLSPSEPSRKAIGQAIVRLLQLWNLSEPDQLQVLGLSVDSYETLSRLVAGHPFPADRDQLERASHLFGIHEALKMLYPENPEMVAGWVTFRNDAFDGSTPLDVVKDKGTLGLALVREHLEQRLHR